ncbi:MAG TPA: DUF2807 domain-containing protein [Bacteroidales bacterium]|nr:DUF2807 domain-containing protein [Bacteroidales bacterium]
MRRTISIIILIASLAGSCLKETVCIDGNGKVAIERRDVTSITGIVNMTPVDVIYRKADSTSFNITAESNFFRHIVLQSSGRKLEIRTDPRSACFNSTARPLITITAPSLGTIELTGSGTVGADSLDGSDVSIVSTGSGEVSTSYISTGNLNITMTGSGNVTIGKAECTGSDFALTGSGNLGITGSAENGKMRVTGSGDIKSQDFILQNSNETITGSGNIYTQVLTSLEATISGSGNIYLRGNPSVKKSISGSGKIINY